MASYKPSIYLLLIILLASCQSKQQYVHIQDNLYIVPPIEDDTNELGLESLLIGNEKSKPLVVFLTGSGLYPIAARAADSNYYYLFHPDIVSDTETYNYLFVSKPHIPAVVDYSELDTDTRYFKFYDDPQAFAKFSGKNTIEYYKKNLPELIQKTKKQLAATEVILMGHSQGARIVAEMTNTKGIDKFVMMSASPIGRMFFAGIDSASYDRILSQEQDDTGLSENFEMGDSYKTWKSFSYSPLIPISGTRKPLLIVFGSDDGSCVLCDVYFTLEWKNPNITVNKYDGLSHSFNDKEHESQWSRVKSDIDDWIQRN